VRAFLRLPERGLTLSADGAAAAGSFKLTSEDSEGLAGEGLGLAGEAGAFSAAAPAGEAAGAQRSLLAVEARGLASNQQFKWRKLYTGMRVKLKPHEIGVRIH
jgi:hypothetical protein